MRKHIQLVLVFVIGMLFGALALAACASPTVAPTTAAQPTNVPPPTAPAATLPPQPTAAPTQAVAATSAPAPTQVAQAPSPTAAAGGATAVPATATPVTAKGKLATVLNRKKLICGVNGQLLGFSSLEPNGDYSGIDAEFCRAVAAALFNDVKAVEFRPLSTQERFAAVQSGEVDILMRNTTVTINRDTAVGMDFLPTTFYDGGGMMVAKKNNIKKLEDLSGATVCVLAGTTNETVLTDVFRARNIKFTPLTFKDAQSMYKAVDEGRCDAATSDKSQLAGQRASLLSKPDDWVIMDDTLSKEPLTPAVAQNDSQWADTMRWIIYATFYAEEAGITSKNVDDMKKSDNPDIQRFLGVTGSLGKDMALSPDAFYRVIKLVGNYGEIYDKTLGANTKLNVPRGLNQSYTKGGLLYAPPFR